MKHLHTVQTSPDHPLISSMEKTNTKSNELSHTNSLDDQNDFNISLLSNALTTTSTPPNPTLTASSASDTSSGPTTYQYIGGIVNYPTAPFITATSPCRISLTMTPQNLPAPQSMEDPLPPLSLPRL